MFILIKTKQSAKKEQQSPTQTIYQHGRSKHSLSIIFLLKE
ncbi:hypothetical protein pb186bvf_018998 [Paramecium bursaria]